MDDLSLAKEYLNQSKTEDAISLLNNIIKSCNCNNEAFFELGKAYFYINDFNNAILNLQKSIEIKDSFWAELLLAKSLRNIKQYRNSIGVLFKIKKSSIKVEEDIDKEIVETLVLLKKYLYSYRYINKYCVNDISLKKDVIYNLLNLMLLNRCKFNNDKNFIIEFELFIYNFLKFDNIDKKDIEKQMLQLYEKSILLKKDEFYEYIVSRKDDVNNLKHYNSILNKIEIQRKDIKLLSKPRSLVVTLNNVCNIKCVFCNTSKLEKWQLNDKIIKNIIDLMPYLERINWLGGEVFLYKDFNKLFEIAKQNNVYQEIVTNGLLLDRDLINIFIQSKMKLSISVTSVNKEKYEYLHNGAKFDDLLKNLDMIKKSMNNKNKNFSLGMYTCVMKENFNELEDIVDFAYKYKFDFIRFQPLVQLDNSFYNEKDVRNFLIKALEKANKYGMNVNNIVPTNTCNVEDTCLKKCADNNIAIMPEYSKNLFCIYPWNALSIIDSEYVSFNGRCVDGNIGSIKKESLLDIWNSQNAQFVRKKIAQNDFYDTCNKNCIRYNVHINNVHQN